MRGSILNCTLLFFLILTLSNCQIDDNVIESEKGINSFYKKDIEKYLKAVVLASGKEHIYEVEDLINVINYNTLRIYNLQYAQKILIADLRSPHSFGKVFKTKVVFYLTDGNIYRSSIFAFDDNLSNFDYNYEINLMLKGGENKMRYTGKVSIYTINKNIEFQGILQDGKLIQSARAMPIATTNKVARTNGCTDYYLVTTVGHTIVSIVYLHSVCEIRSGDGLYGGGGGTYNAGLIALPASPQENDIHTHRDSENVITVYQYKNNIWRIITVIVPAVILINNYHETYNFLNFDFPEHNQLVNGGDGLVYTFNSFSGNWTGNLAVLISDSIAQAIEDNIDDSELDPCTKGVLDKLKLLSQNDIASIFEKFGIPENGTYNIQMVTGTPNKSTAIADTKWLSKNNYLITIRESYIKGTDNNQKPPTDIAVAAIIIHELIHAHFFALFDDFHNNGNNCAYDNYDCLYEKYVTKTYTGTIDEQHAQMFDNYVPKIVAILQEFKPGLSLQFYEDIAMSTMYDLQYFNDKYPKNSPERNRIENNRHAEDTNTPRGTATPKGSPCN